MTKDKHAHHKCEHDLKFCAPCDEAYCIKCELVFTTETCTQQHYPYYWYNNCGCGHNNWTYTSDISTIGTTTVDTSGIGSTSIVLNDDVNVSLTATAADHSGH